MFMRKLNFWVPLGEPKWHSPVSVDSLTPRARIPHWGGSCFRFVLLLQPAHYFESILTLQQCWSKILIFTEKVSFCPDSLDIVVESRPVSLCIEQSLAILHN